MKLHLRAFIAVAVLLFGTTMSFAQQDNQDVIIPAWGVELGYRNGIVYEHPISKHFTMRYSTGILAYHRLQPYEQSNRKVAFVTEYGGLMPFINAGARWYPKVMPNNSGFYLGLDAQYNHHQWKFALNRSKDVYKLENEALLIFNVGYMYNIFDRLNIKAALLPTVGFALADKAQTTYGVIDLRWDLGLVYNF